MKIFEGKSFKKIIAVLICILMLSVFMTGCAGKEDSEENGDATESETKQPADEYEAYIHEALESVRNSAEVATDADESLAPEGDSSGKTVKVERQDSGSGFEEVYTSGAVQEPEFTTPTPAAIAETDEAMSSSSERKVTPETFEVGTGLVYIDGEYKTDYSTDLLKVINDGRTGLNYPAFTINKSLGTCANLRSKEIACYLSHIRPDGRPFYSLTPNGEYRAEIITIDAATPKETFDAWMQDPISRGILFSKEYTTIGAANYVCNGLNCIVVSFGY